LSERGSTTGHLYNMVEVLANLLRGMRAQITPELCHINAVGDGAVLSRKIISTGQILKDLPLG